MQDFRHVSGPLEDRFFYGRDDEIAILHNNIGLRQHTALIGQRQFGKTALVRKAIERHPLKPLKAYVDLTRKVTLHEAARVLLDTFMEDNFGIKRFLVVFRADPTTFMKNIFNSLNVIKKIKLSEFEIELKEINALASDTTNSKSIDLFVGAIEFIDKVATMLDKSVVLFIDEFQRVSQFPEVKTSDVLWPLRSVIQDSKSSTLIVAGSKPTVLKSLISAPDSAFLHSFIIQDVYGVKDEDFMGHFAEVCKTYKVSDAPEITNFVFHIFGGMPSYLSLFGRKLFDEVNRTKKLETWMYFKALQDTFSELSSPFRMFGEKLSEIPNALIVYRAVFSGENPKAEAVRLSGTSDANIQNTTINRMIENGYIIREDRGVYRVVDSALGYYMAETTESEQFQTLYENKVIADILGISPQTDRR